MALDPSLETRLLRWFNLTLASVCVLYLAFVVAAGGLQGLTTIATTAGLSLAVFGKLVIFWGLREGAPSLGSLALLTLLIDLVCASALATGLRGLERASLVGAWLRSGRLRAKRVLREYPGLSRLAFFGVIAFMFLPIAGTGAITGSLVARLLGLSRLAGIGAVALASASGAAAFALLAGFLGEQGKRLLASPALLLAGCGGVVLLALVVPRRLAAELRRRA
ncbi:MAG TPA: small multi-drug export protein [Planctomycetota bacterium]